MCLCITESLCCVAEFLNIVNQLHLNKTLKNEKKTLMADIKTIILKVLGFSCIYFFISLKKLFIHVQLIYNVPISGVQQSDSIIYVFFLYSFPSQFYVQAKLALAVVAAWLGLL